MIEEKFAFGRSFIHQMEPRVKILVSFILSVTAALCNNFSIIFVYFGIALILIAAARLNLTEVIKRLKPLLWFLLMIWLILPVTFDGSILYEYHWLKITKPGIFMCAMITVKSITILLIFTALIATMTVATLGNGLHKLYVPDKLVFLLLMCYRYISVIEEEYKRLLRAAKFRGFTPGTNLHSYKTFAYLAGMLFVRASLRAERVYKAMLCRGFTHKFHSLDVYPPKRVNSFFLIGIVIISISLFMIEHIWM